MKGPDADAAGEEARFAVTCDDCGASLRTDELDEAAAFAVEHRRHTGHSLSWERSVLPEAVVDVETRPAWRVRCEDCDTTRVFRDRDAAERFREDHERYAGHAPSELTRVESVEVEPAHLAAALDYCFEAIDSVDVVPVELVLEAFEAVGACRRSVSRTLPAVESGSDIYERGDGLLARAESTSDYRS